MNSGAGRGPPPTHVCQQEPAWRPSGRFVVPGLDRPGTGALTATQADWLERLRLLPNVEVYIWRPSDWDELVEVLTTR